MGLLQVECLLEEKAYNYFNLFMGEVVVGRPALAHPHTQRWVCAWDRFPIAHATDRGPCQPPSHPGVAHPPGMTRPGGRGPSPETVLGVGMCKGGKVPLASGMARGGIKHPTHLGASHPRCDPRG